MFSSMSCEIGHFVEIYLRQLCVLLRIYVRVRIAARWESCTTGTTGKHAAAGFPRITPACSRGVA